MWEFTEEVVLVQITFAKLRFPPKLLYLPKNTACEKSILHSTISLTRWWKYLMLIQTRIQQKLQEIPESSSIVLGLEEHQNYNLTGSRQQFGEKKQSSYTKEKVKNMGCCNQINYTTKNVAYKKYVQTKTMDSETEYRCRRATAKREIRKDIANPGSNLYNT